jgi:hypothetical protein
MSRGNSGISPGPSPVHGAPPNCPENNRFAAFFANVINRADIGMVQRRSRFGFTPKSFQCLSVWCRIFWQEF